MRIALVENFGADFVGARLRFALFLKKNGIEVTAIIPKDGHRDVIEKNGIKVIEVGENIRGNGVKNKLIYAKILRTILITEKFDIVHFYRLQPNIIGTFIAGTSTKSFIINHVTGLGVAFTDKSIKNLVLQFVIKSLYKFNYHLFCPHTIFQNNEDIKDLKIHKKSICIEGSAVDESRFNQNIAIEKKHEILKLKKELGILANNSKVFLFVSRLLKEKGVLELIQGFIEAQKNAKVPIYLIIVGWSDVENPSSVNPLEIEELIKKYDTIKFLGKRSDIDLLLGLTNVSILPTYYREGTPRFLLESMSMSKAIITTDMPGCNHLIPEKFNGELIKPRDVNEIKNAILRILERDLLDLGKKSNLLYREKFSESKVYTSILNLYTSILK
jgi:glycosyltransferase involved in cell wall biosynthesis